MAVAPGRFQVARHKGEGLAEACFAYPQTMDCLGICRITGQVKSTKTSDGDDGSLVEKLDGGRDHLSLLGAFDGERSLRRVLQPDSWATDGTRNRLGMKAAVRRI